MRPAPEENHWSWRLSAAETLAASISPGSFGVKACYIAGSTKNATAGPESDIDLIIHIEDDKRKREELSLWLDGWSRALGFLNSLKTGKNNPEILDIHYITDDDIEKGSSFAVMIFSVTNAARPLSLGKNSDE